MYQWFLTNLPFVSVTFVAQYCQQYRHLFREVRTFEAFKWLHQGIISELPRKSLQLGWADFRLTDYGSIERWWEIIFSAYSLVSLQADYFQSSLEQLESSVEGASGAILKFFWQHP